MKFDNIAKKLGNEKKNKQKSEVGGFLGPIARQRRLELHMTQSEVADSICSISYLSKIESNKIYPNNRCLTMLMEKIDIKGWQVNMLENGPGIVRDSILYYYNLEKESFDTLYSEIELSTDNLYTDIAKIGYFDFIKEFDKAAPLVESVNKLTGSMEDETLKIFALYAGEYLIGVSNFTEALSIADTLSDIDASENLQALIDEFKFRIYAKTMRPIQADAYYAKIVRRYSETIHIERLIDAKLEYSLLECREREYKCAISTLNSLKMVKDMEENPYFNMIMGISLIGDDRSIASKEYLDKIKEDSPVYPRVVEYCYHTCTDRDYFMNKVKKLNSTMNNFYLDYFIKEKEGTLTRADFESELFITTYNNSDLYETINLLNYKVKFLVSKAKYKDASIEVLKIEKLIKRQE